MKFVLIEFCIKNAENKENILILSKYILLFLLMLISIIIFIYYIISNLNIFLYKYMIIFKLSYINLMAFN